MTRTRSVLCFAAICYAAVLALPATASVIWDNGPIIGTSGTFNINSGPQVFDSFKVSGGSPTFLGLTFGAWLQPGDVLQNVSFEVWTGTGRTGTMVFGASIAVTQSNCSTNSAGKAVCLETITFSGGRALPLGMLWLNIFHATSQNGDPVGGTSIMVSAARRPVVHRRQSTAPGSA